MSRPSLRIPAAALVMALIFAAQGAWAGEFTVKAVTITEMKAVFGQVESRIVVPARARIGGSIREIRISQGDVVKKGEAVAVVVDDKLALQLQAIDARIEALDSQLGYARTELVRAKQLRAAGTGTQTRLDQARTQFEVASKQVTAAKADKAVIAQSAQEGTVFAPATGRVLTVPVTLGSVILPGEEIARIAPGPYYLRLSLPERHATEIIQGTDVLVGERGLTQSPGQATATRFGRIIKVYPEITNGRVIADVEVTGIGDYFVNERMLVSIPVGKRTVLAVPPEAIHTLHGVDYARITTADGDVEVAVILGETFDEDGVTRVEVLTGLHDGDQVVLP